MVESTTLFKSNEAGMLKSTWANSKKDKEETARFLENVPIPEGKFEYGLDLAAGVGRYRAFLESKCKHVYSNEIESAHLKHKNYANVD
jgi:hypothetical protein